jgi:predicted PurR-regulated permease PerM
MLSAVTQEFILSAVLVPVVVAIIAGPIVAVIRRLDSNNTSQHAKSMQALEAIQGTIQDVKSNVELVQFDIRIVQSDVKGMDSRLNGHIDWHMQQKEEDT